MGLILLCAGVCDCWCLQLSLLGVWLVCLAVCRGLNLLEFWFGLVLKVGIIQLFWVCVVVCFACGVFVV